MKGGIFMKEGIVSASRAIVHGRSWSKRSKCSCSGGRPSATIMSAEDLLDSTEVCSRSQVLVIMVSLLFMLLIGTGKVAI